MILASNSPRRKELLSACGFDFSVIPSAAEELTGGADIYELPRLNALLKAEAVSALYPEELVLGADTVVIAGKRVLGKPADEAEALRMLMFLAGKTHEVVTGVALVRQRDNCRESWSEVTRVRFKDFDLATARHYMELVPVLDKAGAYAIQEHGDMLTAEICGEIENVIGLPVRKLQERIKILTKSQDI